MTKIAEKNKIQVVAYNLGIPEVSMQQNMFWEGIWKKEQASSGVGVLGQKTYSLIQLHYYPCVPGQVIWSLWTLVSSSVKWQLHAYHTGLLWNSHETIVCKNYSVLLV